MGEIILPEHTLQVEFLDYGKHGPFCQMFIGKRDGTKVANTPPQPADLRLCLDLLGDMAAFYKIPEYELISLAIQLETAFTQRIEKERKRIAEESIRQVLTASLGIEPGGD